MFTQNWSKEFQKNTAFIDRNSLLNVVEVGSYEGGTSNYICNSLLAHNGVLICVDPLSDDYELDSDNILFRGQFDRFIENTEDNADKIFLIRKKSEQALPLLRSESQDFVFVDGHHSEAAVYADGTEAFRLVKIGGWILFDDFLWGGNGGMKRGIERVLGENRNHKLLLKLNQVLVQKLEPGSKTEDGQDRYQELSVEKLFGWDRIHAAYTNLDSRVDRLGMMKAELERIGLQDFIVRQRSYPWKELYDGFTEEEKLKVDVMYRRTKGAIGCWYSQVEVMKEALKQGRHAMIFEDDLRFCSDFPKRLSIIYKFLNQHEWDIFWLGGTYHLEPTWHKSVEGVHTNAEIKDFCHCNLNRDWEETNNPNIVKTFGAFSTHSWLVNKDRIEHVLMLLERAKPIAIGIDWAMILEQPNLNTFAFRPGCVKQIDSMSDISNAFAEQSGFANLGLHWFADSMDNF